MSRKRWAKKLATASFALALLLAWAPSCFAQATLGTPCCAPQPCTTCNVWCCPPAYKYCVEGPPNICLICGCPKPVCCPCDLPNWGYFATCWRPSPWGANTSHCYGVSPIAQLAPTVPGSVHSIPLPAGGDSPSHLPPPPRGVIDSPPNMLR